MQNVIETEKNKVKMSSAFTLVKDLTNTFREELFLPSLKILVSLNNLRIRKNRPSILIN